METSYHTAVSVYELAPSTFFVSSSLFNRPKFRICPAVGLFSRPWFNSAFLYAACNANTLAAYIAGSVSTALWVPNRSCNPY